MFINNNCKKRKRINIIKYNVTQFQFIRNMNEDKMASFSNELS